MTYEPRTICRHISTKTGIQYPIFFHIVSEVPMTNISEPIYTTIKNPKTIRPPIPNMITKTSIRRHLHQVINTASQKTYCGVQNELGDIRAQKFSRDPKSGQFTAEAAGCNGSSLSSLLQQAWHSVLRLQMRRSLLLHPSLCLTSFSS